MSSSLIAVRDDGRVTSSGPRSGGPGSRRSFSSAQKLEHLAAYEAALDEGRGGAYLRENGLYSSLISEWRRVRNAGVLAGKAPGDRIGKLSAEQVEIARLRRQLEQSERKLATTQVALDIMGKSESRTWLTASIVGLLESCSPLAQDWPSWARPATTSPPSVWPLDAPSRSPATRMVSTESRPTATDLSMTPPSR
jgi:transposase